jgi:signal transduction histidine kinase
MLSTVKLYFQWLSETVDFDKKKSITQTGIQNIDDAIQSLKEISNNLSPRILINMGLIPALKYLIHQINETQKLSIVFNFYSEMRYNQQIEITIYRIISELLNNTIKYAQANNVDITISYNNINNHLIITYSDDGKGFDFNQVIENKKGMGIKNMMQRISTLKGFINFNTKEGKSLQVRIELPL